MRNRMIQKGFFISNDIIELSWGARLLFISLWIHSTDAGIGKAAALKQLKAQCFPADDVTTEQIQELMDELFAQELLLESKCAKYYKIKNWDQHQVINRPNEKEVRKYAHLEFFYREAHGAISEDSVNTHGALSERSLTKEKNRIEKNKKETKHQIQTSTEFDKFWSVYPRKVDKQRCIKRYSKLSKSDQGTLQTRLDSVWLPHWKLKYWVGKGWSSTEFIPHPTTFINSRRYEDDPPIIGDISTNSEKEALRINEERIQEQIKKDRREQHEAVINAASDEEMEDVSSLLKKTRQELLEKMSYKPNKTAS